MDLPDAVRESTPAGRSLWRDERAIEGLPIRLVIALVVGVASLSVMMTMISGIGGLGVTELDAEPDDDVLEAGGTHNVEIAVVDPDGERIEDATVILRGESAHLEDGPHYDETDDDGTVTFYNVRPELDPNQQRGVLEIDIQPPSGSDYEDQRDNAEILVLEE